MKLFKLFLLLLALSYGTFVFSISCSSHDHEQDEAQLHEEDAAHVHEGETEAALHEGEEAQVHEGEDEHLHEGEDVQIEPAVEDTAHQAEADAVVLDAATQELIGLETSKAVFADLEEAFPVPGKILTNENKEVHINTLIPGRVHEFMVNLGDRVKAGQQLICIESLELGQKRAEYQRALAELELSNSEYARKKNLYDQEAGSERQLLEAEAAKKAAEINTDYAFRMLKLTGLRDEEVAEPPNDHDAIEACSVHLVTPIDGVVIEREVRKGEQIEPGTCLFKIIDNSSVWIEADVFEKDLSSLKMGGTIKIKVPAYPDKTFEGKIFYIGSVLNEVTRTVKIRSEVSNRDLLLKPGMFAEIDVITGVRENVLAVPAEAVLTDDNQNYVFLKEGDEFHRHIVELGYKSGGLVQILAGIPDDAEVVVKGNYQLKSRLLMSGVDAHAGHSH
ncbi:efflux RND transporter periplasmic adaptor subunit [candidate division KSB1 bacterium]